MKSTSRLASITALFASIGIGSSPAFGQNLITASYQGSAFASVNTTTAPPVVQTIFTTPSAAGMVVVQPDGRILYTMPDAGQLGRFNPATNTNEILASGFGQPRELTMEPGGTSVLVSDHGGEMVYRINLVNCPPSPGAECPKTVLVNGPAAGVYNPEGITYDGAGHLYIVFQQQSVRQVDPVSGAILNSYVFPVNNHLEGMIYDAFTNSLWVAARDVNGLYRLPLNLASATPVQQANTGSCHLSTGCIPIANGVTSDGTGNLFIAAQGNYDLYRYKIASDTLVQESYIYGIYGVTVAPARGTSCKDGWASLTHTCGPESLTQQAIVATARNSVGGSSGQSLDCTAPKGCWLTDAQPPPSPADGDLMRKALHEYFEWDLATPKPYSLTTLQNSHMAPIMSHYTVPDAQEMAERMTSQGVPTSDPTNPNWSDDQLMLWIGIRKQCLEWILTTVTAAAPGTTQILNYTGPAFSNMSRARPGMGLYKVNSEGHGVHAMLIVDILWKDNAPLAYQVAEANYCGDTAHSGCQNIPVSVWTKDTHGQVPWERNVDIRPASVVDNSQPIPAGSAVTLASCQSGAYTCFVVNFEPAWH